MLSRPEFLSTSTDCRWPMPASSDLEDIFDYGKIFKFITYHLLFHRRKLKSFRKKIPKFRNMNLQESQSVTKTLHRYVYRSISSKFPIICYEGSSYDVPSFYLFHRSESAEVLREFARKTYKHRAQLLPLDEVLTEFPVSFIPHFDRMKIELQSLDEQYGKEWMCATFVYVTVEDTYGFSGPIERGCRFLHMEGDFQYFPHDRASERHFRLKHLAKLERARAPSPQ